MAGLLLKATVGCRCRRCEPRLLGCLETTFALFYALARARTDENEMKSARLLPAFQQPSEPAQTGGGGSGESCSLIKGRLIAAASQPCFFSADKRIILKPKAKIELVPGGAGGGPDRGGKRISPPPSSDP